MIMSVDTTNDNIKAEIDAILGDDFETLTPGQMLDRYIAVGAHIQGRPDGTRIEYLMWAAGGCSRAILEACDSLAEVMALRGLLDDRLTADTNDLKRDMDRAEKMKAIMKMVCGSREDAEPATAWAPVKEGSIRNAFDERDRLERREG